MRPPDRTVSSLVHRLPGGRRAAGPIALVLALLGLAALVWLSGSDEKLPANEASGPPFYLEADIVVLGPAGANGVRPEQSTSTVQWWYARPGVWRWQMDVESPTEDPKTLIGVADGKDVWMYESLENTYTKVSLRSNPFAGLPASVFLGPLDANKLVDDWEASGLTVRSGGSNRYMNRDAQVLEYSPTWRSSDALGERSGGIGRVWVDDETGLILRSLIDGGSANEYIEGHVTLLDLEPRFDRGTFDFEAPPGASKSN
jgi:outer membrane lipoprotein-sorting protein